MPEDSPPIGTIPYATPATLGVGTLVIRTARTSAIVFCVWGCLFTAFAAYALRDNREPAMWLVLLPGVALIAVGAWRLADRVPRLILSDVGVVSVPYRIELRWADVADAELDYHAGACLLILKLTDQATLPGHRPAACCGGHRPEERDLPLPVTGLDLPPHQVLEAVRMRIARQLGEDALR